MKKRWLGLFLLISLLLSACTNPTVTQPATQSSAELPTETSPALTLTDALGRTVTLDSLPQRIVVTGKASLMVLDAMYMFPEARERVVAFEDLAQGDVNFISLLDPNYAEKAWLQRDAGVEQFVSAEPDLVVMKSSNAEKYGAPIEAINIPVVYVDFETPEQYARDLGILGKIFGNSQRAEELAAYYQGKVDAITAALPAEASCPSTLMLQYALKDGAWHLRFHRSVGCKPLSRNGGRNSGLAGCASQLWLDYCYHRANSRLGSGCHFVVAYNDNPGSSCLAQGGCAWKTYALFKRQTAWIPKDLYSWDQGHTFRAAVARHGAASRALARKLMPAVQEFIICLWHGQQH